MSTNLELIEAALKRLEKVLDEENAALSDPGSRGLDGLCRTKTQCLLELQRSPELSGLHDDGLEALLKAVRKKLEVNRWLLFLNLEAAREITAVIVSALRDEESDGTYSRLNQAKKVYG